MPTGAVSSDWPRVAAKAGQVGLGFDDWQVDVGRIALSLRADGTYACGIGGVVLSIPRQVGKTYLIAAIVFALCLLTPNLTVLWTAHRMKTAGETFAKLQAFTRRRKIAPSIKNVTTGANNEVIYFTNGSRILFGARERGFGRGFDDVDVEVFDEAQILTEAAVEDMVPATNVAKNPLLFFIGTPPRPKDPGEVFRGKRRDALAGDPDTAYVEFSADANVGVEGGPSEDDRAQWRLANPSYPGRTNDASMLRMKKNLNLPGSFRREGLGIWDEDTAQTAFPMDLWLERRTTNPPAAGAVAYGVKFSPDGARVALSAAIKPPDGPVHVECLGVASMAEGTTWLADKLVENGRSGPVIVVDGRSGAGDFVNLLREKKMPARRIITPTTTDVVTAHASYLRKIVTGELTHLAQPGLDASMRVAGKRDIGKTGGWGLEPITPDGDVVAAESAVMAHHGVTTMKHRDNRSRQTRREAVIA